MSPRPSVCDSHAASQALTRAAWEHTQSRERLSRTPLAAVTEPLADPDRRAGVEARRAGCRPALPASPSLGTPSERQCGVVATQRPGGPPAPNQRSRPPPLDAPLFCPDTQPAAPSSAERGSLPGRRPLGVGTRKARGCYARCANAEGGLQGLR